MRIKTSRYRLMLVQVILAMLGLAMVFGSGIGAVWGAGETNEWGYAKPIQLSSASEYSQLFLDEEVYARANSDLSDLRIVDGTGAMVPYYLVKGYSAETQGRTEYAARLVSKSVVELDTMLDYQVEKKSELTDIEGNRLELTLPGQLFLKRVEVFGSHDGKQWSPLGSDHVYRTEELVKGYVDLGSIQKFSFYRLKVLDNAENVEFTGLKLIHDVHGSTWKEFQKSTGLEYKVVEEGKETVVTLRNENRLRIKRLTVEAEGNYRRSYRLVNAEGRNLAVEGKPELFRLNFGGSSISGNDIRMAGQPMDEAQFALRIQNEDNAPLKLRSVTAEYVIDKLVFESKAGASYELRYGKSDAAAPRYDLASFRAQIEKGNPGPAELGTELVRGVPDAAQDQGTAWYQSKLTFNIVIIVVSLGLVVLLVGKMNRSKEGT
jgi:hypothetical protein